MQQRQLRVELRICNKMYEDWLSVYSTRCKTRGEIFRYKSVFFWLKFNYFLNSKYSRKLSKDLRHNTVSKMKIGWHFFSRLFKYANTRTFPFYCRLSRSAISIQRNNLQLWISSSGLKILTQNSFVWEASYIYRSLFCKHKPYYYVQPEYIFSFTDLFFFLA